MRHIIGATCLGVYAAATTISVSNPSFEDSTSWTSLSTGSNEFWAAPGGSSYATRVAGETATQQVDLGVTIEAGTTYTIHVELNGLSDSVVELWTQDGMIDDNDDFGGSLGSQLDWTAPSSGQFFVLVRGYSADQRGSFMVNIRSSEAGRGRGGSHYDFYNQRPSRQGSDRH